MQSVSGGVLSFSFLPGLHPENPNFGIVRNPLYRDLQVDSKKLLDPHTPSAHRLRSRFGELFCRDGADVRLDQLLIAGSGRAIGEVVASLVPVTLGRANTLKRLVRTPYYSSKLTRSSPPSASCGAGDRSTTPRRASVALYGMSPSLAKPCLAILSSPRRRRGSRLEFVWALDRGQRPVGAGVACLAAAGFRETASLDRGTSRGLFGSIA